MSKDTVQEIEANIKQAREIVELGRALERLGENRDFQRVIARGYLHDEAVRLVHLKADPSMQRPDSQASVVRDIDSIGALSAYFRLVKHNATQAEKAIEANEAELEDIASEELGNV